MFLALGQQLPHQTTKGLNQRAERSAVGDLIEFAGDEVPSPANDGFVQFLNERALSDTGITGDHHHGGLSTARPIERPEQFLYLLLSPVELVRDQKAIRDIAPAKGKGSDAAVRHPFARANLKVCPQPQRALVTILARLCQQLHDELRKRFRQIRIEVGGSRRGFGNVPVRQFERIVRGKRQAAGQDLIEGDAERIEVRAVIRGTIHPACLLG